MNDYVIKIEMVFTSTPHGTSEQFGDFVDALHEHLETIIGSEFHLCGSLTNRTIDVSFYATEPDSGVACSEAFTTLRTALHAIGNTNHPWPDYQPTFRTVRKLQDA